MSNAVSQAQLGGERRLARLPAEATGFVGRAEELAGITALLGLARLVTAIGPAGVGKTRLARRAAADVADRFTAGTCFIDLSEVRDPGLLASEVAAALGLPRQDGPVQHGAVIDYLSGQRLLLILDTCEHLVDACAAFADAVLRAAPGVTVLATSRQPLDVPGEHTYPVPALPVPSLHVPARSPGCGRGGGDAVDLFAQRAAAILPDFAVTPGNWANVVRLCQRLDGIPLAIELAAVRLRALPLTDLVDRMEHGPILTASRRGTTARHKTMRSAVEWSYGLCTDAEQALWARLSVFTGVFDMASAERVCADESLPAHEVVAALIGLVDKSVVLRDQVAGGRYRLLGILREFGAEKLAEAGLAAVFAGRLTASRAAVTSVPADDPDRDEQGVADRQPGRDQLSLQAALTYALGCAGPPQHSPEWASGQAAQPRYPASPAARQAATQAGLSAMPPPAVASLGLTRREVEIAAMVASGLSNQQIASRLFISRRTVETHVEHIFGKLEISSRVHLVVWWRDHGQPGACDVQPS